MADGRNASALIDFAATVARNMAARPDVPVTTQAIPAMTDAVIDAAQQIPQVRNAFNMEGLGQSRVMVGLAIGLFGTIIAPFGVKILPDQAAQWTDAGSAAITLGGIGYAAYGRIRGSKLDPLTYFGLLKK